jgi:mycothiol synthase
MTVEQARFEDDKRPENCRHQRWVAERDGRIVAYGEYDQHPFVFDPRKFGIEIVVDPAYLSQGIGSALFSTVIDRLRPMDPSEVNMWTREDMACRVPFLTSRGFTERFRLWVSALDLRTFDPTPFRHFVEHVTDQGVQIVSRAELTESEELLRKLFDLQTEVMEDLPLPPGEVRQPQTYANFLERQDNPTRIDEGYFLALADGEFVGVSNLFLTPEPGTARTGLTATRRAYRRRGIAFALKLRALEFAKREGYAMVVTDNASVNRPMLSINEQLGFVKEPAWVQYVAQWQAVLRSIVSARVK